MEEIEVLSQFLVNRVEDEYAWARSLVLLGDFNIFSTDDPTFKAIVDADFFIPPQFREVTSNAAGGKHFDQMAFVSRAYDEQVVQERLQLANAGVFDFFQYVYKDEAKRTMPEKWAVPIRKTQTVISATSVRSRTISGNGEHFRCRIIFRCGWNYRSTSAKNTCGAWLRGLE